RPARGRRGRSCAVRVARTSRRSRASGRLRSRGFGADNQPMRIRSHLVLLFLGILIPILAFSGVMLVLFNRHTRAATDQGLVETARALSVAVDQQVMASLSVLRVLATSEHLRDGHLAEFDRVARGARETQPALRNIVLFAPDMRQLVNTLVPPGTPLPPASNPDLLNL